MRGKWEQFWSFSFPAFDVLLFSDVSAVIICVCVLLIKSTLFGIGFHEQREGSTRNDVVVAHVLYRPSGCLHECNIFLVL